MSENLNCKFKRMKVYIESLNVGKFNVGKFKFKV